MSEAEGVSVEMKRKQAEAYQKVYDSLLGLPVHLGLEVLSLAAAELTSVYVAPDRRREVLRAFKRDLMNRLPIVEKLVRARRSTMRH